MVVFDGAFAFRHLLECNGVVEVTYWKHLQGDFWLPILAPTIEFHCLLSETACRDVKISHHGSKYNTSPKLLDLIDSQHFIISTGGSKSHKLPDREVIARILFHSKRNLNRKRTIYFNYPLAEIEKNSGKFIEIADKEIGNWEFKENMNTLPPLKVETNS